MLLSAPAANKLCRLCFKPCVFLCLIYLLFLLTMYAEFKNNSQSKNVLNTSNVSKGPVDENENPETPLEDDDQEEPKAGDGDNQLNLQEIPDEHQHDPGAEQAAEENAPEYEMGVAEKEEAPNEAVADNGYPAYGNETGSKELSRGGLVEGGEQDAGNEANVHGDDFDRSQDGHFDDHFDGNEEYFQESADGTSNDTGNYFRGEEGLSEERLLFQKAEELQVGRNTVKRKDWTVEQFFKMLENPPARCNGILQIGGEYILSQEEHLIKDGQKEVCDRAPRTNFKRIRSNNCTVYSFGVGYDWSFEKDATRTLKCKVHAFDPESKYLYHGKDHRPMRNLWFYARGIGAKNGYVKGDTGSKWKFQTMDSIMQELGHKTVDLVKMDIQGWEWPALRQLVASGALKKINHLCIEVHFSLSKLNEQIQMIQALNDAGFQLFSAHANPTIGYTFIKQLNRKDKLQYELAWYRI